MKGMALNIIFKETYMDASKIQTKRQRFLSKIALENLTQYRPSTLGFPTMLFVVCPMLCVPYYFLQENTQLPKVIIMDWVHFFLFPFSHFLQA